MSRATLLIELGTAELPPKALLALSAAYTEQIMAGLREAELISDASEAVPYAAPRRLAVSVPEVLAAQPDQQEQRRGPAVAAAFDDDGNATQAATGFARSCGVAVDDLLRLKTDKGEYLSYSVEKAGQKLTELLPGIMEQTIKRLPIPKRMRWGDRDDEFVRPVRWLVCMHGSATVPLHVLGVDSGNVTSGHRFHSAGELTLAHADDYADVLLQQGHVVADFNQRRAMISEQTAALAEQVNGNLADDPALLDEVTALVEYPTALIGNFDPEFLQVPKECLISSMRDHQKYFHLRDAKGELLANFITVSNIQSSDPQQVITGNERVLRARLADARFFWQQDALTSLADRVERLADVTFHASLGSVLDKTQRLQKLAGDLAKDLGADAAAVQRAALLSKADLVSNMVNEFDELQGVMGNYYAQRDGEPAEVAEAIEHHYLPKFAGDVLPASTVSLALALADRLDSLVGIYATGGVPTGDKDPYGLRRAALAILRMLIERELPLNLSDLVARAAQAHAQQNNLEISSTTRDEIVNFIRGRLTAFYQSQGVATQSINAVLACTPDSPLDFSHRLHAVDQFSKMTDAADLAAANKRISNIFKKHSGKVPDQVDTALLQEPAEQTLAQAIDDMVAQCGPLFDAGNYSDGLQLLTGLRAPVDGFFDNVMVMADDPALQNNRLALLNRMRQLFMRVADISQLQA